MAEGVAVGKEVSVRVLIVEFNVRLIVVIVVSVLESLNMYM